MRPASHGAAPSLTPPTHPTPHAPQLKVTEYGQLRSTLQAAARKQGGSLAVRDLAGLVPPGRLVETENLTTLCAVVAKAAKADWLTQYEALAEFVVPRSSEVREQAQLLCGRLWLGGVGCCGAGAAVHTRCHAALYPHPHCLSPSMFSTPGGG